MTHSRWFFGSAVFLAAFLLFLVEPIAAKQLLPYLGGASAVWITCLVFFQTSLLCAYLYAHWLTRHPKWNLHLVLLAASLGLALFWAFGGIDLSNGSAHPILTIFVALSLWIGLPFLALGSTSPLLQVWWARVEHTEIPYRLFALSNLASLLALVAYPVLIEPNLTLHVQRILWASGFAAFALLGAVITRRTRTAEPPPTAVAAEKPAEDTAAPPTPFVRKLMWLLLPMGASMQLSAITRHITANIAPIPLLWILPLAVYLTTIILAFELPRLLPRGIVTRFLAVMLASLGYFLSEVHFSLPIGISISFFLFELLLACLFCHNEAYARRPQRSSESTVFYLLFAGGGALGAFLVGIAFPLLFSFNYDLALTFVVTALLALAATWDLHWGQRLLWSAGSVLLMVLVFWLHTAFQHNTIVAVRNFYGALRVSQDFTTFPGATVRTLSNGRIQHGKEIFGSEALRKTPTTYYARDSGIGLALRFCCQGRPRSIGVIGLGAGTLAAYGKPGDRIRFYEINPAVVPIARNVFTYLRESGARIRIVVGDGRSSLEHEAPQHFNVLAIDAFTGDAIPLHLLTAEALALYRRNLAPGGIVAFHISNQYVNLEPAITLLARHAGMTAMRVSSRANPSRGEFSATWMLVSNNAGFFAQPKVAARARPATLQPGLRLWTDDYSSLLPLLRW